MSESYVISGDGTGEEIEVQKAICVRCGAYEFVSPAKAKLISDDNFKCSLCYTAPGVVKAVQTFVTCSECGQTMDQYERKCFCVPENKPLLTWTNNSKNSVTKKLAEAIEESKMQGLERKIVRTARQKQHDMEVRTDENLQKLVELLLKKEEHDV